MTIAKPAVAATSPFRLPDPPERAPDENMTNYTHVFDRGHPENIRQYLGDRETTLIGADLYVTLAPGDKTITRRRPDLFIARNVSPEMYRADNGYIVSRQGKPPDFVLEVASASTGAVDTGAKRDDYEKLGIAEYWRFDETGRWHGTRLACDRLVNGRFQPIPIETTEDGALQGYSPILDLILRWQNGALLWINPHTGRHITTYDDMREALAQERETLAQEREARTRQQEALAQERETLTQEREARIQAEARVRELEAVIERLRGG